MTPLRRKRETKQDKTDQTNKKKTNKKLRNKKKMVEKGKSMYLKLS